MLSALMTVPSSSSAIRSASADFPLAVGPATTTTRPPVARPKAPLAVASPVSLPGGMTHILVLIAGAGARLSAVQTAAVTDALAGAGARTGEPRWLSPDEAWELPVTDAAAARAAAVEALGGAAVDCAVIPVAGRRKRLLIADMDSTIVDSETLDELAAEA